MIRKSALFGTLLGCLGLSGPAVARPANVDALYSPAFTHCMSTGDARNGITIGIMNCLGEENDRQDNQLNRTYRALIARLTPPRRARLQRSERVWIRERDRACDALSAGDGGGTASGMTFSNCVLDETIRRRLRLEHWR